jgi:hypothetical protein
MKFIIFLVLLVFWGCTNISQKPLTIKYNKSVSMHQNDKVIDLQTIEVKPNGYFLIDGKKCKNLISKNNYNNLKKIVDKVKPNEKCTEGKNPPNANYSVSIFIKMKLGSSKKYIEFSLFTNCSKNINTLIKKLEILRSKCIK